ncbi:hypothetical protein A2397_05045 [Candidatus Amesbacteria bacterium RIFOXYB1_FULL_44_23]|uniref:Transketolase N-terminal domain-containing protein n=1 Tax=Candidatus Amesbacteria bacterium RIFOXYB1_FULL_44_23 TaxID=1797263 RepID=A0A1F4ZU87_9BACT|nr:MAG: hypothetical protein A2397_05045 [Candidatus Amesbacteria bacterium RIFOXYB1_FULL_44_23]
MLKLSNDQKKLRRKILQIIYDGKTSHIGSCLSAIDVIDAIYSVKKESEKFVLSNGHAAVALYAVLEKRGYLKNPSLSRLNVHPDRNPKTRIDLSSGSLGQGLPIALGMALANKKRNVFCMISDGECDEGSIWETLRVIYSMKITNLKIVVSVNGWGAYDPIDPEALEKRLKGFGLEIIKVDGHSTNELKKKLRVKLRRPTIFFAKTVAQQLPFLIGQDAHYHVMNQDEFNLAMKLLK